MKNSGLLKKIFITAMLLVSLLLLIHPLPAFYAHAKQVNIHAAELHDGDIIFQESLSTQSKAIQLATHSPYSHCGIIYRKGGNAYVYEAVQPVKLTPLAEWIARGAQKHYVVKRLRNDKVLTPAVLAKMHAEGERFSGKDYDVYFGWTDDKLYCSELVWKIYQRGAGIEVGKLQKLKSFDLKSPVVQRVLKARYGNNIPLEEDVISPAAIYESPLLVTIQY